MKTKGTFLYKEILCKYNLEHKNNIIIIKFDYNGNKYKLKEKLEMSNFGINDYSIAYLKYLLMGELGDKLEEKNYNPTKY